MTLPNEPVVTPPSAPRPLWPRWLGGLLGAFVLIQLVPYGRAHTNPTVQVEPNWNNLQTKTLFNRACADCHSNRTVWPWYATVAPVSWLVQKHVSEGRSEFNINVPGFGRSADEAAREVWQGTMPEKSYLPMHPEARLSGAERDALVQGLKATFDDDGRMDERGGEGDQD